MRCSVFCLRCGIIYHILSHRCSSFPNFIIWGTSSVRVPRPCGLSVYGQFSLTLIFITVVSSCGVNLVPHFFRMFGAPMDTPLISFQFTKFCFYLSSVPTLFHFAIIGGARMASSICFFRFFGIFVSLVRIRFSGWGSRGGSINSHHISPWVQ